MALASLNCEQVPSNNSTDKEISLLNESNVLNNYIPIETKASDDENPPWMNVEIWLPQRMRGF